MESLSAYARQFLGRLDKPDVDLIEGLSPAISIEQKATSHNPRSTVGTVTEIHDYLRLLFARAGTPFCPDHGLPLAAQTVSQMVDAVLALPRYPPDGAGPVAREKKGEFTELFTEMQARGMCVSRGWPDLRARRPACAEEDRKAQHRRGDRPREGARDLQQRLAESFEAALRVGPGRQWPRAGAGDGHGAGAPVQRQVCLSGVQLLPGRARTAPVLVQLAPGACPACDGLGQREVFDAARVVAFPA